MLLREYPFLGRALVISLLLHAAALIGISSMDMPVARPAAPVSVLNVALPAPREEPVLTPPAQPGLMLPEKSAPAHASAVRPAVPEPRPPLAASSPQRLAGVAARSAMEQISRELYYPQEAIERGLEGEVLVMLFLDAAGNVIAARVEASSGYALLDDAAVKAARTLRSLPDSAPREALLPVRFRLK